MTKNQSPDRASIRRQLGQLFKSATDFDAFCMDHFPDVFRRLTDGMQLPARLNILLQCVEPADIAASLTSNGYGMRRPQKELMAGPPEFAPPGPAVPATWRNPWFLGPWLLAAGTTAWAGHEVWQRHALMHRTALATVVPFEGHERASGCRSQRLMTCLGALDLFLFRKDSLPSPEIKELCSDFSTQIVQDTACSQLFDKLYRYLVVAPTSRKEVLIQACHGHNNWPACVLAGNYYFQIDPKLKNNKLEICKYYQRACQLSKQNGTRRGCAPLYLNKAVFDACEIPAQSFTTRLPELLQLCQVDRIAAACYAAGRMCEDKERGSLLYCKLCAKSDNQDKDGVNSNRDNTCLTGKEISPPEDPKITHYADAFYLYQRGCAMRPAPYTECPVQNVDEPLLPECDHGAARACGRADYVLFHYPTLAGPLTPSRSELQSWAMKLGEADAAEEQR